MKVYATSDLHVDHAVNARWVQGLSLHDHTDDVLIVAGDVSDQLEALAGTLRALARRFRHVCFVPGNHDLWVLRDRTCADSLSKLQAVERVALDSGVHTTPLRLPGLSIVPLLSWYDHSFGLPSDTLQEVWMDFRACRWPLGWSAADISRAFLDRNAGWLDPPDDAAVISFSHFLPRIDLMPSSIPAQARMLYPVLGCAALDHQIRLLGAQMHVYGHSHVNRHVEREGVVYVNNAFAYPHEARIAAKALKCIHDTEWGCAPGRGSRVGAAR